MAAMPGQTGRDIEPARVPVVIRESFSLVESIPDKVAAHFYALMFLEHPEMRDMFPPMMDVQRDRLVQALLRVVSHCDDPPSLVDYLRQLGRDHRKYGVRPEHYDVVWRCLISALRHFCRDRWTDEMNAAWLAAYGLVAGTMIEAAEEASQKSPAWWTARVIHHEQRARDLAVITLLPDHPYPYRPGQYVSLESQRWPRVWRHYSIANAPRPDNTLTLHVRAIPAGWVSTALVNHTSVGDTVRLGPPLGTMFCNTMSARDVLCIAGGTGLAPVKAIIEDMTSWNTSRQVRLFHGARTAEDHYDTQDLLKLAERHPWLNIISPVSHDPHFPGERGMLPDVVARHGEFHNDWSGHDVYISGSTPMVRATIARLQELDIPLASIRFDAYNDDAMDGLWQAGGPHGAPEPAPTATGLFPPPSFNPMPSPSYNSIPLPTYTSIPTPTAATPPAPMPTPTPAPAPTPAQPTPPPGFTPTRATPPEFPSDIAPLPQRSPGRALEDTEGSGWYSEREAGSARSGRR